MSAIIDAFNSFTRRVPTWVLYISYMFPVPWLLYHGQTRGLGAEPIKALEQELGLIALQLLVIGLAITPARRYLRVNLMKFRRALGLLAFGYVCLHLLVWLVLDVGVLSQIWADILKRPYITIGMAGFVCLIPLAATSNNYSIRKLGPKWRQLHRLTYIAVVLGGVHFIWLVKGFQIEPLLYMAAILGLLILRLPKKRQNRPGSNVILTNKAK